MLNVVADYLECQDDAERLRLHTRCVELGKKFVHKMEMWIQRRNREAEFQGTPPVTRGPSKRQSTAVAGLGTLPSLGRISNALEQLVALKRDELKLREEQGSRERHDWVYVQDSLDNRCYVRIRRQDVDDYHAGLEARWGED
jgi:hypothetical protein